MTDHQKKKTTPAEKRFSQRRHRGETPGLKKKKRGTIWWETDPTNWGDRNEQTKKNKGREEKDWGGYHQPSNQTKKGGEEEKEGEG